MRALIFVLVLATPSLVHAQSIAEARSFTATPFVNVTFGTSGETTTSSLGIGGAFGYDVTSNLGFEAEVGHVFDVHGDSDSLDWSLTTITGNVVYHFDVLRVTPYATAGLGVQGSGVEAADIAPAGSSTTVTSASDTEIVYNFGGGIKYKLAENMQARADLRRFQANDLSPDYWRLYGGITFILRR
jgi:opacity protein-like surface antigen